MRIGRSLAGIALFAGLLSLEREAAAHPPADDFLNPQPAAKHLTLMPFIGPGFRAIYDQRIEIEKDMSEVRAQVMGTVAVPFAEVSANVDFRFFLQTFGATVGYHDEWHMLQFNPDPQTGRDRLGQPKFEVDPTNPAIADDPTRGTFDLHRDARAIKDQNADVQAKSWAFYEGRWGFLWPAYNFMGVSNLAFRHDGRPDVTYDWENATVLNGGWNLRWEGYALFRARNVGFIGPALRAMYVPRNRAKGSDADRTLPSGQIVPLGAACQDGEGSGLSTPSTFKCTHTHEGEFHYGILAGFQPNWVNSTDTFLFRAYTTWGMKNDLFGTQVFRQPIQLLFAYMVDIDL
jgi:hypothetical protein